MSLHIPNARHADDPARQCVMFWGRNSTFAITSPMDEEALHQPPPGRAELEWYRGMSLK